MGLKPQDEICVAADADLRLLCDLSNTILDKHKSIVDDFLQSNPEDGFHRIRRVMCDYMYRAPTANVMFGRHRETMLVCVALMVREIANVLNASDVEPAVRLSLFYLLGWCRGILAFAHPKTTALNALTDAMHGLKCSEGINRRWAEKENKNAPLIQSASEIADKLWSEGDKSLDWQMAKHLCEDIPEFRGLHQNELKHSLEAMAEKYGKRSGYKNGKKMQ